MTSKYWISPVLISFVLFFPLSAQAFLGHRLSLGAGITQTFNPNETNFSVGAEYEYSIDPFLGIGASASYIFTTPGVTVLGAPEIFFHPLGGDWIVDASPIMILASGMDTKIGAHVGTRLPIPLGLVTLVPIIGADFFSGGHYLSFGVGILF